MLAKPSLKIRTANAIFWIYLGGTAKKIFFRNNIFCFSRHKAKSFSNCLKFQLIQLIQTIVIFIFSIACLIELKFCEVTGNSFSNRFWKFQLSILEKKSFVPKKEILSCCQYQNKKALFTDQIFSEGFDYELQIARVRKQRLLKRASVRATFCSLFVAKRLWFMFKLLNWLLYMLYCYLFVLF